MPKKTTKTSLTKQLDALWSKCIRSLGYCEKCGSREKTLQAAHIITRSNRRLRWELDNGLSLCAGCHLYWAHKEPLEFAAFVQYKYPTRYEWLMATKEEYAGYTLEEMEEIKTKLKHEYERCL